jgi:hypothetical protein
MFRFARLGAACSALGVVAACAVGVDPDAPPEGADGGGTMMGGDGSSGGCKVMCGGMCSDPKTDNANCGKCGNACPVGASCVQGSCQCMAGTLCMGACVDLQTDVKNCGRCGAACGGDDAGSLQGGGMWTCKAGTCDITCAAPKTACVPNGCFDLQKDNTNCGTCGNDCGGNLCLSGNCCQTGEVNCNNTCTNTQTDANNCGMCGNKCMTGSCTMGKCCSKPPTGNCSHALCTQGSALKNNCDGAGCVSKVCAQDSFCCDTLFGSWDSLCVQEVDQYCGPQYKCSC